MIIKNAMRNLSVKYKIILFTYSVILIITLTLGYLFFTSSQNYLLKEISDSKIHMVKQIDTGINNLQKELYDLSTFIATNNKVLAYINNDLHRNSLTNHRPYELDEIMMNLIVSKEDISLLLLYSDLYPESSYSISTDLSSGIHSYESIKNTPHYNSIVQGDGSPYWFSMAKDSDYLLQNNKHRKIILGRSLKSLDNYEKIGMLFLGMNTSSVEQLYKDFLLPDSEGILITDQSGNVITSWGLPIKLSDIASSLKDTSLRHKMLEMGPYFMTYSDVNQLNWRIYYAMDKEHFTQPVRKNKLFILLIIGLCMFLSLPILLLLTTYITSPLKKLVTSMEGFKKGDFTESVNIVRDDEFGTLGHTYNDMVVEIRDLIDQNYVLAIKEREAELIALQAQINPHFLYNTLDTIYWKAYNTEDPQVSEMIYSLSRLFRLSLNRGKDKILIVKEKELLEHYLNLQKNRFEEKLSYSINIHPKLYQYEIPRFILQPFVENAILHGIEPMASGGCIDIKGELGEEYIRFEISDNGVGMDSTKPHNGYAISNIKERLRLYYQQDDLLQIISCKNKGTTIKIHIPLTNPFNTGGKYD